MSFFVYIIQSQMDGTFYKGFTTNIERRLEEHNSGESRYTAKKMPWDLVYLQKMTSKKEALIREKQIKHFNSNYLKQLIENYKNNNRLE